MFLWDFHLFFRWEYWELSLRKKCPYSEVFWSAFFPHFPAFGLDTREIPPPVFSPSAGKTRTRITSNTDTFYPVYNLPIKPQIESDVFDVMKFLICLSRIIAVSIYAQKSPLLVTLLDGKGKIYFLTFPEFCKPENSITLEVS